MRHLLIVLTLCVCGTLRAQHAVEQRFYPNGRLQSTLYRTSDSEERFIGYYENGRVKEMGSYVNGERDGEWKQFDEQGQLLAQASFTEGVGQGTWRFWTDAGVQRGELRFANGQLVQAGQFGANGELLAQRDY